MAAKGQSYAEKLDRWEILITNAKPGVVEMPHIGEDLAALKQKLTEARALESRQEYFAPRRGISGSRSGSPPGRVRRPGPAWEPACAGNTASRATPW